MKIVLDIEPAQPIQPEWTKLLEIDFVFPLVDAPHPEADLFVSSKYEECIIGKMRCERSMFDGTFSRIVVVDILLFSDGMVPQVGITWNGNNDLEMLRQFWDCMGQPHPSLIITHNGVVFDLSLQKKRSMIHQVKLPFDINLTKFRLNSCAIPIWNN